MASASMTSKVPLSDLEGEHWNVRSSQRTDILKQLKTVLNDVIGSVTVSPCFWALCQTADVSKLESMIRDVSEMPKASVTRGFLEATIDDSDFVVDRWLQNISVKSTTSSMRRSSSASDQCKARDNHRCILTGWPNPEAAHIYPFCLLRAAQREPRASHRFWHLLGIFWEKERVDRWKAELFRDSPNLTDPGDTCSNMLSLDKTAHALWGAGRFALRPVALSADRKAMQIEFYWQKKPAHGKDEIDLLSEPETSRGLYDYDDGEGLSCITGKRGKNGQPKYEALVSGQRVTVNTDDPDKRPLPSWDLLEMQWVLQRVAGMSGAAEPSDHKREDSGDTDETVVDREAPIRRVREVFKWLDSMPEEKKFATDLTPKLALQ
ncbi:conserved hypothetical protein [Histoplasma capsulatum H143]|uniref:HNH nuclease domain-containing protein n=1 Tax=Ajellomyces capsulatus (strain H143) TaxID=544712 RepID=C6HRW9_AJECH|nr:conserved hypothetical protein [Histoplasma capsulatum H143]